MKVDGKVVGSSLIGQTFTEGKYFHAAERGRCGGYAGRDGDRPDTTNEDGAERPGGPESDTAGSNLGPTNQDLLDAVEGSGSPTIARRTGSQRTPRSRSTR